MLLPTLLSATLTLFPSPQGRGHGHGNSHGNPHGNGTFVPPGLAKKGGLPPGLAKKFGRRVPERPYIAIDPRYQDRAWFLIDGHWELRKGFTASLQAEVRDALRLPLAPPPVPLPHVGVDLHVVLFN
ncbi:MAG: hypothetical protein JST24_05420 [Acidobacteria bacterium]|nr:hypothetical protein [Acidobacteriota bacterium]